MSEDTDFKQFKLLIAKRELTIKKCPHCDKRMHIEQMNNNINDWHLLCMNGCAYGERFYGTADDVKKILVEELAKKKENQKKYNSTNYKKRKTLGMTI